MRPFNNNRGRKKDLHNINSQIRSNEVRVILDDGEQLGVMTTKEAIDLAKNRAMDLVEIAPNNTPPVCKIINYGKFKYQEQKKKNEAKKKQKVMETKEVKIRPGYQYRTSRSEDFSPAWNFFQRTMAPFKRIRLCIFRN